MNKITPLRYALPGLIALTFLFSCSKETEALKPPSERILGKWTIVKETEKAYAYNTGAFKDSSVIHIPSGDLTVEFGSDGRMLQTINDNGDREQYFFDYELRGESLLIIDGDEYFIKSFTNNKLITADYYDDGTSDVEHILEMTK